MARRTLEQFQRFRAHGGRAFWALADQGAYPVVQLALMPVLFGRLSRDDFALWILATTIVGMSQLISLGASLATTKHVSSDLAKGAQGEAIGVVRAALSVALVGGALASAIGWLASTLIASTVLRNMGAVDKVATVVALCGPVAAVQEIDNVFSGALRGAERYDLCARVEVVSRAVIGGVIAVMAACSSSIGSLVITLFAMLVLKAILKLMQLESVMGGARFCAPSIDRAALQRVIGFGSWQWLQSAGTVIFTAADQLVVGSVLGAAALSRYGPCVQLAQYVHQIPAVMMQVIVPRVSALGPSLSARRGNEILRISTAISLAISLLLGVPIVAMAHPILSMWIAPSFADENSVLLIILVIAHVVLAFNIGAYYIMLGSGRVARSATVTLSAGAAQLAVALAATQFGLVAVALSRFCYSFGTAFLYKEARYKEDPPP